MFIPYPKRKILASIAGEDFSEWNSQLIPFPRRGGRLHADTTSDNNNNEQDGQLRSI
jgi:hypothetical protein